MKKMEDGCVVPEMIGGKRNGLEELCGCGKPTRYYTPNGIGSCGKGERCPTYEELRDKYHQKSIEFNKYLIAINEIDDFFEYRSDSSSDRKKVYQILGNLADSLKAIKNRPSQVDKLANGGGNGCKQ